jgi:hypothetical protein
MARLREDDAQGYPVSTGMGGWDDRAIGHPVTSIVPKSRGRLDLRPLLVRDYSDNHQLIR